MSRLNILTRELADMSDAVGVDIEAVKEANRVTAEEFQRACAVLDDIEEMIDENESFVEDMDQLIGERSSLISSSSRRIRELQAAAKQAARQVIFSTRSKDALTASPSTLKAAPDTTAVPPSASASGHVDDARPTDQEPVPPPTGWEKARKVVLPLTGSIAGAAVLGPVGLLLGLKGVVLVGAATVVGAGVGMLSGAAVSYKLDDKAAAAAAAAAAASASSTPTETAPPQLTPPTPS